MDGLTIRKWISLCKAARKLPARQWDTWSFIVSASGAPTTEDRIILGQAALSIFGRHWDYWQITAAEDGPND